MARTRWQAKPRLTGSTELAGEEGLSRPSRDEAIATLFRRHYAGLLRLAFCLVGQRGSAEDAVQDAFVSAYAHWDQLRDPNAAPAYLRSAVMNRCRSRIRDRFRDGGPPILVLVDQTEPSSEDAVLQGAERSRLAAAVGALPRRQREVVVCRYYLELSVAETAELLGIGSGSVKRHAHRGVAALAERLGEGAT